MRTRTSWKNQDRLFKALGKEKAPVIPCEWKEDSDGDWSTACGNSFVVIFGTPEQNKMNFCSYCGKPLKQVLYKED